MRLIDGEELEFAIAAAVKMLEDMPKQFGIEEDEYLRGERKAYEDLLKGVQEMPTIEV